MFVYINTKIRILIHIPTHSTSFPFTLHHEVCRTTVIHVNNMKIQSRGAYQNSKHKTTEPH